jgi:hypothetical protein
VPTEALRAAQTSGARYGSIELYSSVMPAAAEEFPKPALDNPKSAPSNLRHRGSSKGTNSPGFGRSCLGLDARQFPTFRLSSGAFFQLAKHLSNRR